MRVMSMCVCVCTVLMCVCTVLMCAYTVLMCACTVLMCLCSDVRVHREVSVGSPVPVGLWGIPSELLMHDNIVYDNIT